jgi:glyoxylase-like metal-dependent hydrolase (beta-lactamase superfamily II)
VNSIQQKQRGAIGKLLLILLAALVIGAVWLYLDKGAARKLKQEAQIRSMEVIGNAVAKRLGEPGGEATHGSAVDLIKRPIEIRKVADNIHYATGVGNTIMITIPAGVVLFDTGLVLQSANQLRMLKDQVSDAQVRYIVLSHSHADHIGGTRFWVDDGTDIITHKNFEEEQRYLSELEPYQYGRNRTLFPWMPTWDERPDMEMMRYGGIVPTITVDD